MTDHLSPEERSWNMSRIKSKNTKPEKTVRSSLHKMGYRFRLHRKDLPGKPDIVLAKHKTVIFVHGCFWHQHKGCKYAYQPKTRAGFWRDKLQGNCERDIRTRKELRKMNWKARVIWECQTKNPAKLNKNLEQLLG
ncbi:DNA mismatch endonuclease Vsr [bacterium]|jgi:DNA mismatch endonuclease, patch repair protein|nr:DNA mismatch endonuclease Vsr [bacterium]